MCDRFRRLNSIILIDVYESLDWGLFVWCDLVGLQPCQKARGRVLNFVSSKNYMTESILKLIESLTKAKNFENDNLAMPDDEVKVNLLIFVLCFVFVFVVFFIEISTRQNRN